MSPRTQQQRSIATRAKLMDATIAALFAHGYVRASTEEVCRRTGLSRGAQLHHYPNKASLMAAAAEHLIEQRHEEFRSLIERTPPAKIQVREALRALWKIYSGKTLRVWMELVVASRTDARLRRSMKAVNDRIAARAEETFKKLFPRADPSRVRPFTRLTLATLDGLALNRVLEEDDSLAESVLDLFESMMRPFSNGRTRT